VLRSGRLQQAGLRGVGCGGLHQRCFGGGGVELSRPHTLPLLPLDKQRAGQLEVRRLREGFVSIDVMPSVYSCDRRKARKAHKCCECHGAIQPGESYAYHHGIWDGEPGAWKTCQECEALREEINSTVDHPDEGVAFEGLCEWIFESGEQGWIDRFVANRDRRGVAVPDWMRRRTTTPPTPVSGRALTGGELVEGD
jgi:hypothetical protein